MSTHQTYAQARAEQRSLRLRVRRYRRSLRACLDRLRRERDRRRAAEAAVAEKDRAGARRHPRNPSASFQMSAMVSKNSWSEL
jgi:hypothetical protein